MSDYSVLFDVAKVRQEDLKREVEITRINRNLRRDSKSRSFVKKLRFFLNTKA